MTFKSLVEEIADLEGKKVEVNIAQISEITKILIYILYDSMSTEPFETLKFIEKQGKRGLVLNL